MDKKILRKQIRVGLLLVAAFLAGEFALFLLDWVLEYTATPIEEHKTVLLYDPVQSPADGDVQHTRSANWNSVTRSKAL